ncbi:MAG: hypothetical protein PVH29_02445 [Candidatus Zixiibacteriota bacterium]
MKRFILVGIVMMAFTAGCFDDPPEEVKERPAATSPVKVLTYVCWSFGHRDLSLLEDSLGPAFVFYFDPEDVGQNPPGGINYVIPECWRREEFLNAVGNMYDRAYSIDLDIKTDGVGEPNPGAETFVAEEVPISLLLMIDELNGYIADGENCFEFEEYENKNGESCWCLAAWRDDGTHGGLVTFGRILTIYH